MTDYCCTECGEYSNRELLTVKKVSFNEMGVGGRVLRSRVVAWLCPKCVKKDPQYNQPAFRAARFRQNG